MDAHPTSDVALRLVWAGVIGYWVWSAGNVKAAARTESRQDRLLLCILPLLVAAVLLGPGRLFGHTWLRAQFASHSELVESLGLAISLGGALLACYARAILGRNWSGTVQLKHDHELIQRGPYRYVRHPIYTGFLLLFLGSAVMLGEWRGLLGLVIVFACFWRKLRIEESWLLQHFGARYAQYIRQTKAIVPGLL
jgi:protein-S-isoprenylcysteine O-methyltransferase Ste14